MPWDSQHGAGGWVGGVPRGLASRVENITNKELYNVWHPAENQQSCKEEGKYDYIKKTN